MNPVAALLCDHLAHLGPYALQAFAAERLGSGRRQQHHRHSLNRLRRLHLSHSRGHRFQMSGKAAIVLWRRPVRRHDGPHRARHLAHLAGNALHYMDPGVSRGAAESPRGPAGAAQQRSGRQPRQAEARDRNPIPSHPYSALQKLPLRFVHRRPFLGAHRIHQHHALNVLRIHGRIAPHDQPSKRMPHQQVRARDVRLLQQLPQFARDV